MAQLIVYFSRRGENYVSGRIQPLSVGNTEVVARRLQVLTGADLFQLEPVHPYSDNYNLCIDSGYISIDNIVKLIKDYLELKNER